MKGIFVLVLLGAFWTVKAGIFDSEQKDLIKLNHTLEEYGRTKDVKKLQETPLAGEEAPNEEVRFLLDFHTTDIKIRAEQLLSSSFPGKFPDFDAVDTEIQPLGYLKYVTIHYTNSTNTTDESNIFLIRGIFYSKYIFHVKVAVDRGIKGGLFGQGFMEHHNRENKTYLMHPVFSTVMKVVGPKMEDEHEVNT